MSETIPEFLRAIARQPRRSDPAHVLIKVIGYAREELVAELGAAFLRADLDLTPEPRADHAADRRPKK